MTVSTCALDTEYVSKESAGVSRATMVMIVCTAPVNFKVTALKLSVAITELVHTLPVAASASAVPGSLGLTVGVKMCQTHAYRTHVEKMAVALVQDWVRMHAAFATTVSRDGTVDSNRTIALW